MRFNGGAIGASRRVVGWGGGMRSRTNGAVYLPVLYSYYYTGHNVI